MFKITNNNIFITRGETAVYDVVFVTRRGSPLILTKPKYINEKYYIEFVVRKNTENRTDYLIREFLELSDDIHLFDDIKIIPYDVNDDWNEPPVKNEEEDYENYLHFKKDPVTEKIQYKRWDAEKEEWVDYRFRFMMPFEYADINSIKPDTYVYEINLLAGKLNDSKDSLIDISLKKTLLVPHEFKVGGSIGE